MINSKSFTLGFTLLFFITSLNAQVGIGTTDPQGALDITSTTDGLLIPRVALVNLATVTVVTPTESELVYNTTSNAELTPGYYYLSTATGPWVRIGGANEANSWLTIGNAGLNASTNFIGTTDGVDVAFRRNNIAAGRLSVNSTSFGLGALNNGASSNSTAFGIDALNVSTGEHNVAIGNQALRVNNTGEHNVAVGYHALYNNQNSIRNTALGYRAMFTLNSSAHVDNVAVGWHSMADANAGVNNTFIGSQAGRRNTGNNSVGVGRQALGSNNGGPSSGIDNVGVGHQALSFNSTGRQNTGVGAESLQQNITGNFNTGIGFRAGGNNSTGNNNTLLGYQAGAGKVNTGSNNTLIGFQAGNIANSNNIMIGNLAGSADNGSNKLYIHNSGVSSDLALIYGEFDNNILRTNGQLQIGNPAGTGYAFPTTDGTAGQYLQTNGNGAVSWANQSDSKSIMRANMNANQELGTGGWQKILFNTVLFDTNSEFNTTDNRFVASTAGYYQINAGYHTNSLPPENVEFYSIAVYVNGNLYQETSSNQNAQGQVSRNINCIVNLAAGGFVEIFVQNFEDNVELDSFTSKTFFEVQQIR